MYNFCKQNSLRADAHIKTWLLTKKERKLRHNRDKETHGEKVEHEQRREKGIDRIRRNEWGYQENVEKKTKERTKK